MDEKTWIPTQTQNLVKYAPAGTYYLRGRFGGHPVREKLESTSYRAAVIEVGERLAELRATRRHGPVELKTLADALQAVRIQITNDPTLKASSRRAYFSWLDDMKPATEKRPRPAAAPETPLARLSCALMEEWWSRTAGHYAPARANQLFMVMRRAVEIARNGGALERDPMANLKRMDIPPTELVLVTVEKFQVIVAAVRARSSEAADWVEFMTYSGMRPGEVEALLWQHIDEAAGIIRVHGGEDGPKNRRKRPVPIVPAMAGLLERMRDGQSRVGKVFGINRPKGTFKKCCAALGVPEMRIYDLRHMFATICAQSGIDVPTFAKWLGHRDGGKLALRTYVHPGEDHSRQSALKVRF